MGLSGTLDKLLGQQTRTREESRSSSFLKKIKPNDPGSRLQELSSSLDRILGGQGASSKEVPVSVLTRGQGEGGGAGGEAGPGEECLHLPTGGERVSTVRLLSLWIIPYNTK